MEEQGERTREIGRSELKWERIQRSYVCVH
jgi:hypothetical protein